MKATHIKVNGEEIVMELTEENWIREVDRLIDCSTTDHVILSKKGRRSTIMFVDDNGLQKDLPVNPKATKLYHAVCVPGTTHQIVGDVVVIEDME